MLFIYFAYKRYAILALLKAENIACNYANYKEYDNEVDKMTDVYWK